MGKSPNARPHTRHSPHFFARISAFRAGDASVRLFACGFGSPMPAGLRSSWSRFQYGLASVTGSTTEVAEQEDGEDGCGEVAEVADHSHVTV